MDQICPKNYFRSKNKKGNITTEFCILEWVKVPNFNLNWQFWFLEPNLLKMSIWSKLEKSDQLINSSYFKFLVANFSFKDKICPKRVFPAKTLGSKFQLEVTIFIFWTKFAKRVFPIQIRKKWTQPLNSAYSNQSTHQISV